MGGHWERKIEGEEVGQRERDGGGRESRAKNRQLLTVDDLNFQTEHG